MQTLDRATALEALRQNLPYRIPKGYQSWEKLSAEVVNLTQGLERNSIAQACRNLWLYWIGVHPLSAHPAPIYCLSNELLRQFEATDTVNLPKLVPPDWVPPLSSYLLMLPENSIRTPDGKGVSYLLVALSHPDIDCFPAKGGKQLTLISCDQGGGVWNKAISLGGESIGKLSADSFPLNNQETTWLERIASIALQCSLALSYLPELVEEPAKSTTTHHQSSGRKPRLSPRWIGRNFTRPKSAPGHGTHASPIAHWRRGHWRRQPVGQGRQQTALTWVRPTLIGATG